MATGQTAARICGGGDTGCLCWILDSGYRVFNVYTVWLIHGESKLIPSRCLSCHGP